MSTHVYLCKCMCRCTHNYMHWEYHHACMSFCIHISICLLLVYVSPHLCIFLIVYVYHISIFLYLSACLCIFITIFVFVCVSHSLSTWVIICLLVYFGYLSVNLSGQLSVCTSAHVCLPVNLTLYVNRCTRIIDQSHRANLREHLLYAVPTSDCSSAGHSNFVIVLPSGDFAK